jgi:hypothetical protein
MNAQDKSHLSGRFPLRQQQQGKPAVAQRQVRPAQTQAKHPAAPAVYRPQPVPKVLQTKTAMSQQHVPQARRAPVAPATYTPQPMPKVLQTKVSQTKATAIVQRTPPPHSQHPPASSNPNRGLHNQVVQPTLGWGALGAVAGAIVGGVATGGLGWAALGLGVLGGVGAHLFSGSEGSNNDQGNQPNPNVNVQDPVGPIVQIPVNPATALKSQQALANMQFQSGGDTQGTLAMFQINNNYYMIEQETNNRVAAAAGVLNIHYIGQRRASGYHAEMRFVAYANAQALGLMGAQVWVSKPICQKCEDVLRTKGVVIHTSCSKISYDNWVSPEGVNIADTVVTQPIGYRHRTTEAQRLKQWGWAENKG